MMEDKRTNENTNKDDPLRNQRWASMPNPKEHHGKAYFQIKSKGQEVIDMLLKKNIQYGNSVLEPNRIFSKADSSEQIKVRIDDKLNRLILGNDSMESDEDIIFDLIGYLILLLVHQEHYTRPLPEDDET